MKLLGQGLVRICTWRLHISSWMISECDSRSGALLSYDTMGTVLLLCSSRQVTVHIPRTRKKKSSLTLLLYVTYVSKTGFVINPVALFMTIISDSEHYILMLCVCRYMQVKKIDLTHEYRLQTTS